MAISQQDISRGTWKSTLIAISIPVRLCAIGSFSVMKSIVRRIIQMDGISSVRIQKKSSSQKDWYLHPVWRQRQICPPYPIALLFPAGYCTTGNLGNQKYSKTLKSIILLFLGEQNRQQTWPTLAPRLVNPSHGYCVRVGVDQQVTQEAPERACIKAL